MDIIAHLVVMVVLIGLVAFTAVCIIAAVAGLLSAAAEVFGNND